MKTEKIVISFIAVLIGIFVAGIAFYLYQSTKTIPDSQTKTITVTPPTPTQSASIFLSIDKPVDEEVVNTKTITVSGKTSPEATIIISTDTTDQVITPARNGNFSATITIGDDQNHIEIMAVAPNGDETRITRTVTYSTESF